MNTERNTTPMQDLRVKEAVEQVLNGRAERVEIHRRGASLCVRVIVVEKKTTV